MNKENVERKNKQNSNISKWKKGKWTKADKGREKGREVK